jgi:hypothetical protein
MREHRNPRPKLPKRPLSDNLAYGLLIRRLYESLVEIEALAIGADEAVTNLPVTPTGRHKRTIARLYSLVGRAAGRASEALEVGEELLAKHEANVAARTAKPARRGAKP